MLAETVSVKCLEHSYQHSAPDLALMYVHVYNLGGSSARSYCGATYNTSLCAMTKGVFNILIFFSEPSVGGASYYYYYSLMLDYHSFFKSA